MRADKNGFSTQGISPCLAGCLYASAPPIYMQADSRRWVRLREYINCDAESPRRFLSFLLCLAQHFAPVGWWFFLAFPRFPSAKQVFVWVLFVPYLRLVPVSTVCAITSPDALGCGARYDLADWTHSFARFHALTRSHCRPLQPGFLQLQLSLLKFGLLISLVLYLAYSLASVRLQSMQIRRSCKVGLPQPLTHIRVRDLRRLWPLMRSPCRTSSHCMTDLRSCSYLSGLLWACVSALPWFSYPLLCGRDGSTDHF